MSTTYVSLGLSDDGSTLVDEFNMPLSGRRGLANLMPLTTLIAHPRAFTDEWLGAFILLRIAILFKDACAHYPVRPTEAQMKRLCERLQIHALGKLPTRPEHVRLFIDTATNRLQVTREQPTGTVLAASLLLAALALSGRDAAARTVGHCVLDQMAVLHPDAFAPFPALAAPLPPNQEPP